MISIKNVTYTATKRNLINDISASFENGKIHLILGPNGAGKSTLIKVLSGELKPTGGQILYDNNGFNNLSVSKLAKFRAVLSQNVELSFPLSIQEVVMLGRYPHFTGKPTERDEKACTEAMGYFDIIGMKDRNYVTLSGGEKQRVQFARVFAQLWYPVQGQSRYLFLDEPLTFLDIFYQYDFMRKVREFMRYNKDLTVIGVVHDLNIAAKFADNVILIKDANIKKTGSPEGVLTKHNIKEVFNIAVKNYFEVEK